MRLRTVLLLMVVVGGLLAAYSFKLHEHFITADEAELRHACRRLCSLRTKKLTGAEEGAIGAVVGTFAGRACEVMDDAADALVGCRDQLAGLGVTVSDYRCLLRATTIEEAEACNAVFAR